MKIYEKLLKIQVDLIVQKTKYNSFADFKYRSLEDILVSLKPFLKEHNCIILFEDEVVSVADKTYIKSIAYLIDVESGDKVSATAFAQEPPKAKAKMDESQTTGSTSSYARKYALNALLALDDNEDSDETNKGDKTPKPEKLITKEQLEELKKLGFDEERLQKMAGYYKVKTVDQITYKQANETIRKQKKAVENGQG